MKKIFTLFAALAMVMSMSAATTRIYCKNTQSWWKADGAAVGAYYWGTGGNANAWPGTRMTKVSGETDLWYIDIDVSKYQNIIFTRVNGSGTVSDWGTKTGDLTIPTNGNNLFTITTTSASWGGGVNGTWSKYVTTVTVTIQAENGTVTGLASGGTYDSGSTATLTAVPNDGYEFVNWTVGGKEVSTANPYTFTVNDNITLVANFKEAAAKSYTITTSATNGTVEGAATVVDGESVTLTATANPGYKFVNWTVGGVEVSTDNPYTFVPTEDVTVVANFEQLPPETVYFVNAADWTGTINIHAWGGTASGTTWPGNPAHKEDYQIGGHDVYSLTAAAGAYANVIFNNKVGDAGNQTTDLEWTAGKYYVVDEWLTKEEAEEKLASGEPLGLTYNVTVPAGTNACYIAGEMNGWSQQEMTKVDDTHYTITIVGATTAMKYKYCSGPAWDYEELNADGSPVADRTHSENDVVAKWKKVYNPNPTVDPEPDPTYDYYVVGTFNSWANPDPNHGMTLVGDVYKATVTLNVGANMLKVTNGTWDNAKGFDAMGAEYEEVSNDTKDGNILITLTEGKDVVVVYNATTGKVTFEGLTEKVVVTPDVITYVLMGVGGDWTTGIALTKNETAEYGEEYFLLGQEIAEGDAVKVVTLVNGVAKAWCGAVETVSPVKYEFDENGNIVLLPGKYDFYFKVNDPTTYEDDAMYITGEAYPVEPEYDVMDITMTNLVVEEMEGFLVLTASDDENTGLNVMLALNEDGSLNTEVSYMALVQGWSETVLPIVEGTITKAYNEELATDVYTGLVVVEYGEGLLGLNLTMYAKPIVVTDVVVTDATITVETEDDGMGGTYENITVSANWNESVLVIEGVEKAHEGFIQIKEIFEVDGEEDWYIWMCMNGVITTVDNVLTVTGEFKNNWTGDVYNVTISGTLPGGTTTALDNIDATVAPVKAIVNGQLVITKDGVQYNAAGAQVK